LDSEAKAGTAHAGDDIIVLWGTHDSGAYSTFLAAMSFLSRRTFSQYFLCT
jgi:hypothetical protein